MLTGKSVKNRCFSAGLAFANENNTNDGAEKLMNDPLQFPVYEQTFTVRFPTKEAAENAKASIAPLPLGKKLAFTTRWDDSNPRHLNQQQTLAAHGLTGSFLLNSIEWNFPLIEKLLEAKKLGAVFGNHGKGHEEFDTHTPNFIFERFTLFQAEIEWFLDTASVSFTFPNGRRDHPLCTNELHQVWGEILNRGGIYSYPVMTYDIADFLQQPKNKCFSTHLFNANDKNPDPEMFRSGFAECKKKAFADPDTPRVTLGVHTWQDDNGFVTLGKLYEEYGHDPEIWYCSENEYAAYRYNFYHAKIEKTEVKDNEATFKITRFEPAFTGAKADLCIQFTERPADSEGVIVPDSDGHNIPATVDRTESGKDSAKFPGICCALERVADTNYFKIVLRNSSQKNLENVWFSLILPMKWKQGVHRIHVPLIKAGASFGRLIDASDTSDDPLYQVDRIGYDLRTDFVCGGQNGRIHTLLFEPYEKVFQPVPRDTVRIAGPYAKGAVPESAMEAMSKAGMPLKDFGRELNLRWCLPHPKNGWMPFAFTPYCDYPKDSEEYKQYKPLLKAYSEPDKGDILLAFEFESGSVRVGLQPKMTNAFWIDGKRYAVSDFFTDVALEQGIHRIVISGKSQSNWALDSSGYVCGIIDAQSGKMVPCRMIE